MTVRKGEIMSITAWIAVAAILFTIAALLRKVEPRLVLLGVGLFLCVVSLKPIAADRKSVV